MTIQVDLSTCRYQLIHMLPHVNSVARYISEEMTTNAASHMASQIASGRSASWKEADSIVNAYASFKSLVRTGGLWDHKAYIVENFGAHTCKHENRKVIAYDVWSNVHYGYIGLRCGFSEWELLSGAGWAQLQAGLSNVPSGYWKRRIEELGDADFLSALDDPRDQAAIKIGFKLWKNHPLSPPADSILAEIEASTNPTLAISCNQTCHDVKVCGIRVSRGHGISVVIDPGHGIGSTNVGSAARNLQTGREVAGKSERSLVLSVALELKVALLSRGYAVSLTRDTDTYQFPMGMKNDIADRAKFSSAQNADYFISLHADGGTASSSGAHAIYRPHPTKPPYTEAQRFFAETIFSKYTIVSLKDSPKARPTGIGVLNPTTNNATFKTLLELGFASNEAEWDLMNSQPKQIASQIADGLDIHVEAVWDRTGLSKKLRAPF